MFGIQLLTRTMATNSSSIEERDSSTEQVTLHFVSLCLLAPCTFILVTIWDIKIRILLLLTCTFGSFAVLGRFLPSSKRVRPSDMYLYFIGITGQTSQLARRELWILILYGLVFHNLLNLLNSYQMAFKTVSTERKCYQTIQEAIDADLGIMASFAFEPFLATVIHPKYQDRITLTEFTKLDLKTKHYAYLVSCDVTRWISRTAANYDQRTRQFMMEPIREPIGTIILSSKQESLGPEFVPETGILQFRQQEKTFYDYHEIRVPQTAEKNVIYRSVLWEVVWLGYMTSVVVFVVEHVVHSMKIRRSGNKVHRRMTKSYPSRKRSRSESHFKVNFPSVKLCGYETV